MRCNLATILKVWLSSPIVGVKKYASSATDLETCDELRLRGDEAPSYGINSCRSGDRSLNGALRRPATRPCSNPGGDPRHTCERALPRKDLLLYAARRLIERPCHRAGTNDPRSGASSQMGYAPKQLTPPSHQVSPDMMQPRRTAMMAGRLQTVRGTILR